LIGLLCAFNAIFILLFFVCDQLDKGEAEIIYLKYSSMRHKERRKEVSSPGLEFFFVNKLRQSSKIPFAQGM
jgi:hypothetical protein